MQTSAKHELLVLEHRDIPCVGLGQSILRARVLDGEPPWPVASLQIFEPVDRYSRGTRGEL